MMSGGSAEVHSCCSVTEFLSMSRPLKKDEIEELEKICPKCHQNYLTALKQREEFKAKERARERAAAEGRGFI